MTKKDLFPLPRMQETMESMVGARFFSSMDLKSGFWQVQMSEKSRQYTTFTVGSLGMYEFLWMPYGLCNAPATFQRLMQKCLGELNLTYALVYLDDVIVYSKMEEDHLRRLHLSHRNHHENSNPIHRLVEQSGAVKQNREKITQVLVIYQQTHRHIDKSRSHVTKNLKIQEHKMETNMENHKQRTHLDH